MRRRVGTSILLVLVLLLAAEAAVRAVGPRLPTPLRWHSWEAQRKVDQMDAFRRFGVRASYVFIGTSMMNVGLDPAQLKEELHSKETPYNAALSLGIPRTMDTWTTRVVFPRLRPHVVVVGLTSFDLPATFSALRESANDAFLRSPAARKMLGKQTLVERLDERLQRLSALYRERWLLRSPSLMEDILRDHHIPTDADAIGNLGVATRRRSETYKLDPVIEARRKRVLRNFRIGTIDADALRHLVSYADAHDASVVFVNMPVTKHYVTLHSHGRKDYDKFVRWLRRFANEEHSRLIDATSIDDVSLFADDIHLNGAGTKAFTKLIAEKLR